MESGPEIQEEVFSFTIAANPRRASTLTRRMQAPSALTLASAHWKDASSPHPPGAVCPPTANPASRQAAVFPSKGPFPISKGPVTSVATNQTVSNRQLAWPKTHLNSIQTECQLRYCWPWLFPEFLEPNGCGGISPHLPLHLADSNFSDFPSLCVQICEIYANNMVAKGCPCLKTHT